MKNEITPQLQQIAGIGEINLIGGQEREIQVNINKDKLEFYGLSILNVTQAVSNGNQEFPAAKVKSEQMGQITVRLSGKLNSVTQMNDLVVGLQIARSPIKLSDIASVADVTKEPASIFRTMGRLVLAYY